MMKEQYMMEAIGVRHNTEPHDLIEQAISQTELVDTRQTTRYQWQR
jgi:hypothetical protein